MPDDAPAALASPLTPPPKGPRTPLDRATASFVWLVWAAMLATALVAAARFASRIPFWDEWNAIVPVLTGRQAVTLAWLWSPHNEHRIFLPRLVMLAMLRLSGDDFRIGPFLNVLLLSAIAAVGIRTAAALRSGRAAIMDILFPLLLIHLRHFENIFWMFQCQVILAVLLTFCVFCSAVRFGGRMPGGRLLACAAVCLLIPMCGAFDLMIALPLSVWVGSVAAVRLRRAASSGFEAPADGASVARGQVVGALALSLMFLILTVAYFLGLHEARHRMPLWEPATKFVLTLIGFGAGESLSQPILVTLAASVPILLVVALILLARRWRGSGARPGGSDDRARLAALMLYLLGALGGLASMAYGRLESATWVSIPSRYALLAGQLVLGLYLTFLALGGTAGDNGGDAAVVEASEANKIPWRGRDNGNALATLLAAVVVVIGISSLPWAWKVSDDFTDPRRSMDTDMAKGAPLPRILALYGTFLFPSREYVANNIQEMAQNHLGAFRDYQTDYAFAVHPLTLGDSSVVTVRYESSPPGYPTDLPPGAHEFLQRNDRILLANPPHRQAGLLVHVPGGLQRVRAVRVHLAMDFPDPNSVSSHDGYLSLEWQHTPRTDQPFLEQEEITGDWHPIDRPVTLYIDEPIGSFLVLPLGRYRVMTITGIDLLLPVEAAAPGDRIETAPAPFETLSSS